ncbi:hypothetical protein GCM10025865_00880 [Paraoerskovia sediminicola]|uniref:Uncharacterized protein n=1 Tax=Paraoerskovia sediminicola TaxID=1138587 RepID=A0ABN6X7W5_9CELL|nr:hypothetical protein [Paraoerskovia sediminicola]BDZ40789.1 hypothetical protein GCM10025865_00880 [Paraoerskovia sediminicola]
MTQPLFIQAAQDRAAAREARAEADALKPLAELGDAYLRMRRAERDANTSEFEIRDLTLALRDKADRYLGVGL